MGMKEAVISAFNNYVNFDGRARRSEYWYFVLFNMLVNAVFAVLISFCREGSLGIRMFTGLSGLYSLAVFLPGLALCWRRLHDIGKSGAYYFIAFIPLVGPILVLVWLCREGDAGDNAYGPDPKAAERYEDRYSNY